MTKANQNGRQDAKFKKKKTYPRSSFGLLPDLWRLRMAGTEVLGLASASAGTEASQIS